MLVRGRKWSGWQPACVGVPELLRKQATAKNGVLPPPEAGGERRIAEGEAFTCGCNVPVARLLPEATFCRCYRFRTLPQLNFSGLAQGL